MTVVQGRSVRGLARPPYRTDVQGLRALAVAMVVFYHARVFLPGGFVGVDVFFVLSGFVIGRGLVSELERTGRIDLREFAMRRVRRLLPAFSVLLVVVVVLSSLIGSIGGFRRGLETSLWASLFNANSFLALAREDYFSPATELNPLLHTWSLSVEEQFYFVFPSAMAFTWFLASRTRRLTPRRGLIAMLVLGSLASFWVSVALVANWWGTSFETPVGNVRLDATFAFYSALLRSWEFAAGALIVFLPCERLPRRIATLASGAGLVVLGASAVFFDDQTAFPGHGALLPVAATCLLLAAGERSALHRPLSWSPLQRLGELSYGWYLWHWPAIVFVAALTVDSRIESPWVSLLAASMALIPASISLRLVEHPIRHLRSLSPFRTVLLAGVCVAVPIAAISGASTIWERVNEQELAGFESTFGLGLHDAAGCDRLDRDASSDPTNCQFVVEEPAPRAALLGDSNAGHFTEGAVAGLADAGVSLEIETVSSCLFADTSVVLENVTHEVCQRYVRDQVETLTREPVEFVFLASAFDSYVLEPDIALVDQSDGTVHSTRAEKLAELSEATARTVSALAAAGSDVIVLHPVVRPQGWDPAACSILRWRSVGWQCEAQTSTEDVDEQRRLLDDFVAAVHEAGGRVAFPMERLCGATCSVWLPDGSPVFRDQTHITKAASESLADFFAELVDPARIAGPPESLASAGDAR